ncbi:Transcriptional regulator, contains XRE-family HTH domain [Terribacillus aidingensis]|uniref:Transcriptional regulator, contains XRE-family HTH domain n=1 Tax=Terribacillus aidingensis TaxID=586416 RepID=A0A285N412_9BACI|nr:helix-turn-helix transcriptional regulator [Terribacillus aidingensis]SNZ04169.1 Transcriptional regulator, contains XRE-family HTH domain [Terribacillus aidingensis]
MNLDRLSELRKKKNWSLQYTADRLGIAKSTYAGYESGYRRPSFEALLMLADLFETTCDELLGRSFNTTIEITNAGNVQLSVDQTELTEQERIGTIAFIRATRELQ